MSQKTKKYYWLKQKESFFTDPKIKKLRKIAGGDTYTIIYQKIMLLSISDGGIIKFEGIEKTLHEELALKLDEEEDNVQVTLNFMQSQGLIEDLEDDSFLMPNVPTLIGSESDSADRVRKFREKKALQCNSKETKSNTENKREERREQENKREDIKTNKKEIVCTEPKIEIIDTNPRPNGNLSGFDIFWGVYPVKESPGTSRMAFYKALKKTSMETILEAIEAQKHTKKWKDGFIPHPTKWLDGECWANEVHITRKQLEAALYDKMSERNISPFDEEGQKLMEEFENEMNTRGIA